MLRKAAGAGVVVAAQARAGFTDQQRQPAHQLRACRRRAGEPGGPLERTGVERLAERVGDGLQARTAGDDAEDVMVVGRGELELGGAAADHHAAFADLVTLDARAVVRERDAAPDRARPDRAGLAHRVAGALAEHLDVVEPHVGNGTAEGAARELVVALLPSRPRLAAWVSTSSDSAQRVRAAAAAGSEASAMRISRRFAKTR